MEKSTGKRRTHVLLSFSTNIFEQIKTNIKVPTRLEKEGTFDASGKKGKDWWCSGLVGRLLLLILSCLYNQRHSKKPDLSLCKHIWEFPTKG